MLFKIGLFLLSFLLVAFAQPDWSSFSCIMASTVGFALFWRGLLEWRRGYPRFCAAFLWFALVELIHFNWFMKDRYVGGGIYLFLFLLTSVLALSFALFSLYIHTKISRPQALALAGVWTCGEWVRLFLLSGFSWDPLGLSVTATLEGLQLTSFFGVYGLTFLLIWTNLEALRGATLWFF